MRHLYPSELKAILKELQKQKLVDEYAEQKNKWAFLAAAITNNISRIVGMFSKRKPKMVEPDDFMNKDAKNMLQQLLEQDNQKDWSKHIQDAKQKGLNGPW